MDIESLRNYCIIKAGVTEGFPFDEDTLVFKVMGKMFALVSLKKADAVNLKCDPAYALSLRETHEEIKPGYHMSKTHWNTVSLIGSLTDAFICSLIDHSYDAVVAGLSKKDRLALETME